VFRHTDAAGALIARRDGLDAGQGHLTALDPAEDAALRAIVGRATQRMLPMSGAMRISRPSGKAPLILVCYPLPRSARMLAPLEAAALVTIVDPHFQQDYPAGLYRQAFRLTAREAEIAAALMQGHSVESAAAVLGMSVLTARTHLRNLFEKTGTSSQARLVRLLTGIG
jgi:DNA-binding CsgD family transcriptional regulator